MISKEIKKKIGDVEMVKILRDGNLLVSCKTEEQKSKTKKVTAGIPVVEDLNKKKHCWCKCKQLEETVKNC